MTAHADHILAADEPARPPEPAFDALSLRAPFLLRCGALLIDYLLIVVFPVAFLLLGRLSGSDGTRLLTSEWSTAGWLIGILAGGANFLLLPIFTGQSVGKMVTGIRIVTANGGSLMSGKMLLRQTAGYAINILTLGLGFLLSIFTRKGRALHDLLFGSMVIYAERRDRRPSPPV